MEIRILPGRESADATSGSSRDVPSGSIILSTAFVLLGHRPSEILLGLSRETGICESIFRKDWDTRRSSTEVRICQVNEEIYPFIKMIPRLPGKPLYNHEFSL